MNQESILSGTVDSNCEAQLTKPINLDKVTGKCPYAVVYMNNVPVNCLIDSGSEVTTITKSCYDQHFKQIPLYECHWINLSAANGSIISIEGLIIVDITIKEKTFESMYVLVSSDPTDHQMQQKKKMAPGILGCNVIPLPTS